MDKVEEAIKQLTFAIEGGCDIDVQCLLDARKELEMEMVSFLAARERLENEIEMREKSLKQSEQLFKMKWQLLEEETRKLSEDKKRFDNRRQFYERVNSYEDERYDNVVNGELFFKGVANYQALKKRYKDLLKIYHPDTMGGDNQIVQEINREYSNLKHSMAK